jgi:ADP-ribose pyrophosphatase
MSRPDLSDRKTNVALDGPERLGRGRHAYERYRLALPDSGEAVSRDVVRVGRVVVVLPFDPSRNEMVLIRQFRVGAQLASGRGELIEVPAGHVEPGEDWVEAAGRECLEETGLAPRSLIPMFRVLPSPGMSDEYQTFFLGVVDASRVPDRAGAAHEHEDTRPFRVSIDEALAVLATGGMEYAASVLSLQWLALNRTRLLEIVRSGTVG